MGKPICIQIVNKAGTIVVVPVTIWENGLKLDSDWKVYNPPIVRSTAAPVVVDMPTIKVVAPMQPTAKPAKKGRKR